MSDAKASIILGASLLGSSLILAYAMGKLGDDIIAAGIHSTKVSLQHNPNDPRPLRVLLHADSEVRIQDDVDSGN